MLMDKFPQINILLIELRELMQNCTDCYQMRRNRTLDRHMFLSRKQQDGNVPSRRHILGSKIFKEQLLEKFGKFFSKKFLKFFFEKKVFLSRTMPKNSKRGHSGSFNVFYKPKTSKKCKGVPFDKFQKFSKKVA